ncbi:MAG: hypothetical protein CMN32_05230 [Saprospirales bacterium]|nr:hypothetical protein [Saprospirales bacterium]
MKHLFTLFLFFVAMAGLQAKHIIGGVLSYECLGDGNYRFTMKMYRDCAGGGAQFDNGAPFSIYKGDSQTPIATILRPVSQVIPINPEDNPCLQIPPGVCVEEGIYIFEYQFADWPSDESYTISYQRCCRNEGVTNIVNPDDIGATFTIELTPFAQAVCNNSPVYNDFPPIVICANEPLNYDHSAFDPDGDQLIYEFCAPFIGGGKAGLGGGNQFGCDGITPNPACPPPYEEVEFVNPPFSPLNPMGGSPTVSIDPVTGMLTGTPNLQGQFTVGVCIKEFRNGQLLSIVRRDFQFTVTECEPLVDASMGGLNVQPMSNGYRVTSCGGTDIQILNTSQDMNHIEEVVWRFKLPDTTLNASSWDLNMTFPGPGIYEGALLLNPGNIGCSDSTKVHLEIYPEIHPDFDYAYDTCVAGPVSFTNKSFIDEGGQIASFSWDFDDGTVDTANYHATHIYNEPGDHLVSLTIRDQNDCQLTKAETVSYNPVPALILVRPNDTVSCVPSEVFFNNLSTPIDDSYDIHWDFGDGETSGEISPVHTYRTAGIFDIRLEITSPIGCYTDTLFPALIEIQPPPVAGFYYAPEVLDNFNPDVAFFDASEYSVHWDWYIDGNLVAQKPDFEYSFQDTGRHEIMLVVTHPQYCQDTLVQVLDVVPKTTYFLPNAFSPNEDSVNDYFKGVGHMVGATDFHLVIFDRWSNVIFEADSLEEAWNGQVRNSGRQVPAGVYPYVVSWQDPRGERKELRGFVTLIR